MKIEFINHASYIIEHNDVTLITDPWMDGLAFYEGWDLLAPTQFKYNDFERITHIWFSHEHPDHFSPSNISKIPIEIRRKITVLFQITRDKKVVDFCRKVGFKQVVELQQQWYTIGDGFELYNKPHSDGDSWLCTKTDGIHILNVNDCVLKSDTECEAILDIVGHVDVLFTQFSYANWAGNKEDIETRRRFAKEKTDEIVRQSRIFRPSYIVPFASFVWFCHEENFFLNDGINTIGFIDSFIREKELGTPVIMAPGSSWIYGSQYDSKPALDFWNEAYKKLANPKLIPPKNVDKADLLKYAGRFAEELKKNNSAFIYLLRPTKIFVTTYKMAFEFSLSGLKEIEAEYDDCDIALSADALAYCFQHLWGGSTIRVNGRYQVPKRGRFFNFKMYFQIAQMNNFSEKFNLRFILQTIWNKVFVPR